MAKQQHFSTFQVAAAYIGTVVGAGFASGQEILQFFGYFGRTGLWGIGAAGLLFAFFGALIMRLGWKLQADSHQEIIRETGGAWVGSVVDAVITFFLFGALVVMSAGAGAIFREQFGMAPLLGSFLMLLVTVATVVTGIRGVINSISLMVPFLLIAVISIGIVSLARVGFSVKGLYWSAPARAVVSFWPLSVLLYVSYNLVMAVAVLAPMGKGAPSARVLINGAILGGLGLAVGSGAILIAVLANAPGSTHPSVPMAAIAAGISPLISSLYTGVLLAEIYSTAVGSLYGFVARLTSPASGKYRIYVVGTAVVAFFASQLGFTNLVRYLFPAVGYAGLLMLGGLLWQVLKPRFSLNPIPAMKPIPEEKANSRNDKLK